MDRSQARTRGFQVLPVALALIFNVIAGPFLPIVASAATNILDYSQCEIGNPKPVTLDCDNWINGILNATKNDFAEDEVVPQRAVVDFDTTGAHSITIAYMARKTSGNVAHAYDYLATWNYTYVNADKCQDLNPASLCIPTTDPTASTFPIPSDGNSVAPGGPQPTSAHELPQADRQFVMYGGDITGTSAITHTVDPMETGSDYGVITINFNVTDADGRVMLLFGGHLAAGQGERGWGPLLGAGSISGGPYHIRLVGIDGESIGNRDNQIMSNAITPLLPALAITKTADAATVSAGSNIGFTITVTNNGPGVATDVTLSDPLPAGSGVSWAIDPAYAGQGTCGINGAPPTQTLNCSFGPMADDATTSVHVQSATTAASCQAYPNTATADAGNFDPVQASATTTVLCPGLSIQKSTSTPVISAGQTATYTITVSNAGQGVATGVTITDTLPSGLTWVENPDQAACTITSGVNLSCTGITIAAASSFSVTVQGVTDVGDCPSISNTASYTSTNGGSGSTASTPTVITVNCPALTISKTPDGGTVNAGDPISFTITIHNGGPGAATNVDLDDTLPAGFEWVESPDKTECTIAAGLLHCDIPSLASGADFSVTVTSPTQAADCGLVTNTATADADNHAQISNSGTTTVQCPNLTISKTPDGGTVNAGSPISFTILVSNSNAPGTGTATNVDIDDDLPTGFEWVENPDKAECTIVANHLHCDIASLAPGASFSVTVTSPTQAADCGTVNNPDATADADNNPPVTDSGTQNVQCPGLNVSKVADPDTIDAGETAAFDIVVWNIGPGTATGVTLEDQLPGDIDWNELSPDCNISASNLLTCSFGDLGVTTMENSPARVSVFGTTDREDCAVLDNTAIADATNDEPVDSSASITIKCPEVEIEKTNNQPAPVLPGTLVTYTLEVNVTDGPANGVVVVDTLPLGLDDPVNISDGGDWDDATRTITWDLGVVTTVKTLTYQAAVSATAQHGAVLTNVAVVTSTNSQCPVGVPPAAECDDDSTVTVRVPTLVVDKAANVELITRTLNPQGVVISINPNTVTWTLTYTLTNGPVTNAVITEPIPAGLTFVSASNGGTFLSGVITWSLGTLTTSGSVTFVTSVNANALTGEILNVATIDSTETLPDNGQDSIRIVEEQELGSTSIPNTAMSPPPVSNSLAVLLFGAILISSLGALAYANVRSVRQRR